MTERLKARRTSIASRLALALVLSSSLFSQQNPTGEKPGDPPSGVLSQDIPVARFRSRSDLVLVPVVIRDRNGKHVTGLPRRAFQLREKGKEQAITLFEEVSAPTTDATMSRARYQGIRTFPLTVQTSSE